MWNIQQAVDQIMKQKRFTGFIFVLERDVLLTYLWCCCTQFVQWRLAGPPA